MDISEIYKQLAEPFPIEMEKTLVKSGVSLIYLPISEVIARLNKVLGVNAWSFEIVSVKRDEIDADEIIAHVNLIATIGESTIIKHGIGGQSVKRMKKDNKPVDLGNDFKGAVSDALKKAAQQLGIGLYLARSSDALDAEDAINAGAHIEEPVSENEEQWNSFVEITKGLTKEQKDELNTFWSEYSNGRPKPTKSTATKADLDALIVEGLRLQFGGGRLLEENND
jgi:hypothetical protein